MIDLSRGFSPIRSQGQLGSCACFAAASILEYIENRIDKNYDMHKRRWFSPLYLYFYTRQEDINNCVIPAHMRPHHNISGSIFICVQDQDAGSAASDLAHVILDKGFCLEKTWEYDSKTDPQVDPQPGPIIHKRGKFATEPSKKSNTEAKKIRNKIIRSIDNVSSAEWTSELDKENPIFICIKVHTNFRDNSNGVRYLKDPSAGVSVGGHGVVIVGYDKKFIPDLSNPNVTIKAFKIRNSWGIGFGINGYLWIKSSNLISMLSDAPYTSAVFVPQKPFNPLPGPRLPPPIACFTATPVTGPAPLKVTFHNNSTGTIHNHVWDFGTRGKTSKQENPSFTYDKEGTYMVTLTVSVGIGRNKESTSYSQEIVVSGKAPPTPPDDDDDDDDNKKEFKLKLPVRKGDFRYVWYLFDNEEGYKYCEILNRFPHGASNFPLSPSVMARHPKTGEKTEINFRSLFRTQSEPLGKGELTKINTPFYSFPDFPKDRDLIKELKKGKHLGLGTANAVEGNTFWSSILGTEGKKMKFNVNELYWKWQHVTLKDIEKEKIIIQGKVINVKNLTECDHAKTISGATVKVFLAEKNDDGTFTLGKEIKESGTRKDGTFTILLEKSKYENKTLLIGSTKKGFLPVIITNKINNRRAEYGFNVDEPCGNPQDIIETKTETYINDIIIPLKGKDTAVTEKYPMIFFNDKNKKIIGVPENKVDSRDAIFGLIKTITSSTDKKHHWFYEYCPENFGITVKLFIEGVEQTGNNFIWKFEGKREYHKINEVVGPYTLADLPGKIGSQINVTAIREELKQLVIVTPDYAKQKIVISVLLIDKDNLTNYNNEVKIVIDSAVHNDLFSNYVKGLPEPHSRGVYDFDNIILELDMKKEEDLLVKMLKARLKKKLYQGMRLYSKSRDINNELQLLLKAKGIEIEYNGEAKKRLILVIKEFLESKKAVIKPADQQIYDHCLLFATLLSNKHKGRSIKDKEKSFLTEFQIKFPKLPESSTTKYNMKYYDRKTGIISDKEQRSILLGNLYAFIIYLNEHS